MEDHDKGPGKLDTLSSVSPVDFRAWRAHVTLTGRIQGWNHRRHRKEALGAFRGAAYARIWMVPVDLTDQCGPIEEALDAWQAQFITASGTHLARRQFDNDSQQKAGESILDYHTRLMELFTLAWPNVALADADADERLLGKFVDGLANAQIATKLYDMDLRTYTLLRHHAERLEGGRLLPQNNNTHPRETFRSKDKDRQGRHRPNRSRGREGRRPPSRSRVAAVEDLDTWKPPRGDHHSRPHSYNSTASEN